MVHYVVLDFETDFGPGLFGADEVVSHFIHVKGIQQSSLSLGWNRKADVPASWIYR